MTLHILQGVQILRITMPYYKNARFLLKGRHSLHVQSSTGQVVIFALNSEVGSVFLISWGRESQSWGPLYLTFSGAKSTVLIQGSTNLLLFLRLYVFSRPLKISFMKVGFISLCVVDTSVVRICNYSYE